MNTINDVHQQFAEFFNDERLKPFAYLISKKLSEGSICFDLEDAENVKGELPGHYSDGYLKARYRIEDNPFVGAADAANHPFIVHHSKIYLQRYFKYETAILDRINAFLKQDAIDLESRMQRIVLNKMIIRKLFSVVADGASQHPAETDWQFVAVISALLNSFTIITGGPGTGKTTTVAKLLAVLFAEKAELKVALAAPTGKAAVRMGESIKSSSLNVDQSIADKFSTITPVTIYRLLKYIPDSPYFRYNREHPLPYDVVIVDEGSMIDLALFSKLLEAIGPHTKIIVLGDKDQLASVEAGSLFGDLCQSQSETNVLSSNRAEFINGIIEDESKSISPALMRDRIVQPMGEHILIFRGC